MLTHVYGHLADHPASYLSDVASVSDVPCLLPLHRGRVRRLHYGYLAREPLFTFHKSVFAVTTPSVFRATTTKKINFRYIAVLNCMP